MLPEDWLVVIVSDDPALPVARGPDARSREEYLHVIFGRERYETRKLGAAQGDPTHARAERFGSHHFE